MPEFLELYPWVVLGVAISILLPVLRKALPQPEGKAAGLEGVLPRVWRVARPYLALGLFSCLAGLIVLAALADQITQWNAALLAGYAADSTLQKLR
ncbi:hypothetical protein NHN26_15445 [Rhodovulum tesquicola]|uniref:hypothetical protein n=1 Tax=Rhodovulum tesquicola TaxID=540254 RepID=UPI00209766B4|nr:hypothetical protein [Rhodovulum tesquicola]MCO8146613.1 hypothetical protein [Rhodovulum tesquicola]